ncbi:MAG: winged helix-turn-helix transcriptional regulator [Planctomycetes bacterium]|nr:winged helix-turn-helix transcriptional regulator [Planctomycetota bacterium]
MTTTEDRNKILTLLAGGPQDAREIARKLGISRNPMFSLLMKMEKEDLIMWHDKEWAVKPSSDSIHPSEGGSSP